MRVVVMKFGGSSLSTTEKIKQVAQKVVAQKHSGCEVAVVVSAMGNTTDGLVELARATSVDPPSRELDILLSAGEQISMALLSMAITCAGQKAISLSGPQAGIITTDRHNQARIIEVQADRVKAELALGRVVVVAGFQGRSRSGELTTLGRGGSDTSAVALACALNSTRCEIYSDVDGVYSSDPRLVPGAHRLDEISYHEMQELALHGAQVLNLQAVELARRHGLEIRARSTFFDGSGTRIRHLSAPKQRVVGIAGRGDLFRIKLQEPKLLYPIRQFLGETDLIRVDRDELLVSSENFPEPAAVCRQIVDEYSPSAVCTTGLGSVSVIGSEVGSCLFSARRARAALAQAGLGESEDFTSPLSITCLVPAQVVPAAIKVLHHEFIGSLRHQAAVRVAAV